VDLGFQGACYESFHYRVLAGAAADYQDLHGSRSRSFRLSPDLAPDPR
jgi:hypothetical protein